MLKVVDLHLNTLSVIGLFLFCFWQHIDCCNIFVGRPEEQDDSENSTIYLTGLTEKANVEEMAEFFKHVGPIRVRMARPSDYIFLAHPRLKWDLIMALCMTR